MQRVKTAELDILAASRHRNYKNLKSPLDKIDEILNLVAIPHKEDLEVLETSQPKTSFSN